MTAITMMAMMNLTHLDLMIMQMTVMTPAIRYSGM
jgi:hypothetical protein